MTDAPTARLELRLYVAGLSPNSQRALQNLRAATVDLGPSVDLEVVDLLEEPERGLVDRILVTPTLVRVAPSPQRKIIGDLSDAAVLRDVLNHHGDRDGR